MKLFTQIPLEQQRNCQIDYHSELLFLGSCFVENMGDKFAYFKFKNLVNPFGILFHPIAIETLIHKAIHAKKYSEKDLFFNNEQWHCFDAHSKLSTDDQEELLRSLNEKLALTAEQLHRSTHIIITFGTAWVYTHIKANVAVANCHRVPQKDFAKHLLSIEEITNSIQMMVNNIHRVNPKAKIIFTVSPVRHLKDGFVENTLSKAHIISAIHHFLHQQSSMSNQQSFYFPSYEIMLDELRDYRFYAEDMLHPNMTAISYIWNKFKHCWIDLESQKVMNEVEIIQTGINHRPFNENSDAHQKFIHQLEEKKTLLQQKYPHISF